MKIPAVLERIILGDLPKNHYNISLYNWYLICNVSILLIDTK
jgi:hypothetical protein